MNIDNNTLIYFADPLCSWCYGFAPEITRLLDSTDYKFKLVMGGLRPGGTDTLGSMQSFLEHHWKEVEKRSGQPFNYTIFEKSEMIVDTEPSARAVVVARDMKPIIEFDFYKEVQKAFYQEAADTTNVDVYEKICKRFDMDFKEFSTKFNTPEFSDAVKQDFIFSQQLGVRGFPTLALKANDNFYLVSNGYRTTEEMLGVIQQINSAVEEA